MLSKMEFEPDVDSKKKKEERQRAEPSPDVEHRNVGGIAESRSLANQNLADKKTAQDEEQLDAIKTAVTEDSKDAYEVRIEHDKPVCADHTHDCRSPEYIEAEDTIGGTRLAAGRDSSGRRQNRFA